MEDNKLIKLPMSLGLKINEILKTKIQFTPRKNKMGILSCEFTSEELALIDRLVFENPVRGAIEGVELLPNLKSLIIKSVGNPYYRQDKYIASISDKDGSSISKCINLELLKIENQAKLSYIDIAEMKKLHSLSLTRNSGLEEIDGLDMLTDLWTIDCIGNESLIQIDGLNNVIMNNPELTDMNMDVLLFPDAVGYQTDGTIDEGIIKRFEEMNITWQEILSSGKNIKINNYQMVQMHKKACEALREYVPQYCENKTAVLGIEQYLAENVKYDDNALKNGHSHSYATSNDNLPNIVLGPIGGANGAYNAFIYNTCVCEGYTRAMQYLLRLKGIKSHNVHCISGEDKLHMASDKGDDIYKIFDLPDDGYHSIISIDDMDYLYDDPCWNASRYQRGDKTMPWTLLTKEEISRDHTLSFGEKNIDNNTCRTTRESVQAAMQRIGNYRNERKKNRTISEVVYQFAGMAGIEDKKMCDDLISHLSKLDINDSIDTILVSLNSLLNRKLLSKEQILSNADSILALNPEKYKSTNDLIKRLEWIKSMNMEYPQMTLTENHRLVLETFDKFNGLIGTKFDSFYTGGLMGYLATNHELERYHGDLDLFINEEQLVALYELVQQSEDFEFVSNMDHKEENGHEFKIIYKGTPMSIGLFLFSRLPNKEMVLKEYFYPNQDKNNGLVVNERHLTEAYSAMVFSTIPREHNGKFYKTQSLEGIYHSKRDSRPKDRYAAQIIHDYVDMGIVHRLDTERQANYNINNKPAIGSIVERLDGIINGQNIEQNVGHRRL